MAAHIYGVTSHLQFVELKVLKVGPEKLQRI